MKICYLGDASSVHIHKWAGYFSERGAEVFVISLGDGVCPGATVYSFGLEGFSEKSDWQKYLAYSRYIKKAKEIIEKEKPDIIHAHYATSYGRLAAKINIHPYILSVWGADVYDFPKRGFLQEWLLRYNLKKADAILSTSEDMKRVTERYTDKEIIVTPFGVDTDLYRPIDELQSSKDEFIVGTVKALSPKYGISYLIRGYYDFLQKTEAENTKLLIAGKGEQEEELKELTRKLGIEDKTEFLGFIPQKEVIETFNRMDVAVFPSTLDSESFGVAAVEAQACGCAAVVSNAGGLPEATKEGYSSIVVRKRSRKDIARALSYLYRHPDVTEQMKKNGRQYVLDHYRIEDNFSDAAKIYDKMKIDWYNGR